MLYPTSNYNEQATHQQPTTQNQPELYQNLCVVVRKQPRRCCLFPLFTRTLSDACANAGDDAEMEEFD